MTTTKTGRVVYERKPHEMRIKDTIRMLERMSLRGPAWIQEQLFPCHALFVIAKNTYEPFWLDSITLGPDRDPLVTRLWNAVEPSLREVYQNQVREICNTIGEEIGIPLRVREFVLDVFFKHIWNVIWSLTNPLFRGHKS